MKHGTQEFIIKDFETSKCTFLAFNQSFAKDNVMVQLSPAQDTENGKAVLESAAVWAEQISLSGFTACVDTSGPIRGSRVGSCYF